MPLSYPFQDKVEPDDCVKNDPYQMILKKVILSFRSGDTLLSPDDRLLPFNKDRWALVVRASRLSPFVRYAVSIL